MSFAKKTLISVAWAFSTGYANIFIAFVGNLLLARTLPPEDFGTFALASSLLVFVTMFTGFGSQEAIMQCRDEKIEDLIPTAFWLSLAIGIAVAILAVLTGLMIRSYYGNTISLLIISLAMLVPITSSANAYSSILRRDMVYRPVALTRTISTTSSFVLGIIAALSGAGPWALLVRQASEAIIYWAGVKLSSHYRVQVIFNLKTARWIWNFGWKQMLSQMSETILGRYDNLLIGTFMGDIQLGYYSQSYRLALIGQQFTQGVLSPLLLPMFATVQSSREKLNYGFERVSFWICRVIPLLGALIFVSGKNAVIFLYGEKWATTGRYFELMSIFFIFLPFAAVLKSFLVGSGQINDVVKIKLIEMSFFIVGVSIGVLLDNMIVILWIVNATHVLATLLMGRAAQQVIPINWRYICVAPVLTLLITIIVGQWLATTMLGTLASLLLLTFVLTSIYAITLVAFDYRSLRREIHIVWKAARG